MALGSYSITITKMCNYSITAAGARNRITDIDVTEDTEEWVLCDLFFWQAVMEALQDGEWRMATDRVAITKDGTDPTFGTYDYRVAMPTDSLLIMFQVDEDNDRVHYDYKREGDWLLTNTLNEDDEAHFIYVKKNEDVTKYSPLLVRASYINLAIKIRSSIKSIQEGEWDLRLQREYKDIIKKARGQNQLEDYAIEGNTDVLDAGGSDCCDREIIGGRPYRCY